MRTSEGIPSCRRTMRMLSSSDVMLCSAPTARVRTCPPALRLAHFPFFLVADTYLHPGYDRMGFSRNATFLYRTGLFKPNGPGLATLIRSRNTILQKARRKLQFLT